MDVNFLKSKEGFKHLMDNYANMSVEEAINLALKEDITQVP